MSTVATPPPLPVSTKPLRRAVFSRRGSDILAIAWLQHSFTLALFRKQGVVGEWTCPTSVTSLLEFAPALEAGIVSLGFSGTDAVLLLDQDAFVHQMESAPPLAPSAVQSFLRAKVERHAPKDEPTLWVGQPLQSSKKEAAFLLHLLPSTFYRDLNSILIARQLDLTRILPVTLPLQGLHNSVVTPKERPSLTVTEIDGATVLLVFSGNGQLLLTRHMRADWATEPERLGIEANRTVLYVKQQFGLSIDQVMLYGRANEAAIAEVTKRCPRDVTVTARSLTTREMLEASAKLPVSHPVNLLSTYLIRKRRVQFTRRAIIALSWIAASLLGLSLWTLRENAADEARHFAQLRVDRPEMIAERDRLLARNAAAEKSQATLTAILDTAGPAVPPRFLAAVASTAPQSMELSECSVRLDPATQQWTFKIAGQIRASEDVAQEQYSAWQKALSAHPLRINVNEATRTFTPSPYFTASGDAVQRFTAEGLLLEK